MVSYTHLPCWCDTAREVHLSRRDQLLSNIGAAVEEDRSLSVILLAMIRIISARARNGCTASLSHGGMLWM